MVSTVRPAGTAPIHARTAPPGARAASSTGAPDRVTLSGSAPEAESGERALSLSSRLALAGFAAVALLGGVAGAAAADPPRQPVTSRQLEASFVRLQDQPRVVQDVRTYISDMIENNRVQAETLNTYGKSFWNNWNTLYRLEQRILQNPSSLNDPAVRRIYEKVVAAMESAQIFDDVEETRIYSTQNHITVEAIDGTRMRIPQEPVQRTFRQRQDYSGAARMTDKTVEDIRDLIGSRPAGR